MNPFKEEKTGQNWGRKDGAKLGKKRWGETGEEKTGRNRGGH